MAIGNHDLRGEPAEERDHRTFRARRAMNSEVFRAYVEQMLAPSLEPGVAVVLDNLPAHNIAGVAGLRTAEQHAPETNGKGFACSRILSAALRLDSKAGSLPALPCG